MTSLLLHRYARGLVFPYLALVVLSVSCLALVEIGGRMQVRVHPTNEP